MTPRIRLRVRHSLLIALVLLPVASPGAHAEQETERVEHKHSRHHIEATFGAAYNDGKSGLYTGFEYEYRFGDRLGVGAFLDGTFDGFDLAAFGVVSNFHPGNKGKVVTGLGVERKTGSGNDKLLFRVGGAYEFHVGNGTISPTVAYDFLEDSQDVVYAGVALGFGF